MGLYLLGLEEHVDVSEQTWSKFARSLVFTKIDAHGLETFKDPSMMHGPRYYYFQTMDVGRLVQWLRLKPRKGVPPFFEPTINAARSGTDWQFDWKTQNVFLIYHCGLELPKDSEEFSSDMLLIDGTKVVYMTDAWTTSGKDVDDPLLCLH